MKLASGIKQVNDTFRFELAAPGFQCVLIASKVPEDKRVANGPDWNLWHAGERCGALWKTTPRNGGDEYLEGNLESPVFPGGKVRVAVFKSKHEDRKGQLDLVWTPPREDRDRPASGGSCGTSQGYAPGTGSANPAPAGDDDEIPF